jgi:CMP/dCMP kinase
MIIAISGKSGCGNTTVSRLLAETLGYKLINYTFHTMAEELGIAFPQLLELAKGDPSYDKKLDRMQVRLASSGDCVIGSRLAAWLLKDKGFTVYLSVSAEVRARRIALREGSKFEDVLEFTAYRDRVDRERYLKLYGIDNDDYSFVNKVIEADDLSPPQIVTAIMKAAGLERSG